MAATMRRAGAAGCRQAAAETGSRSRWSARGDRATVARQPSRCGLVPSTQIIARTTTPRRPSGPSGFVDGGVRAPVQGGKADGWISAGNPARSWHGALHQGRSEAWSDPRWARSCPSRRVSYFLMSAPTSTRNPIWSVRVDGAVYARENDGSIQASSHCSATAEEEAKVTNE